MDKIAFNKRSRMAIVWLEMITDAVADVAVTWALPGNINNEIKKQQQLVQKQHAAKIEQQSSGIVQYNFVCCCYCCCRHLIDNNDLHEVKETNWI